MYIVKPLLFCAVFTCTFKLVYLNNTDVAFSTTLASLLALTENIQKLNCSLDEVREFALTLDENAKVDQEHNGRIKRINLELTNCTLPILTNDLLAPLDVIRLSVINSKVSIVGDGWLNGLDELEALYISGNRFRELQSWSEANLYHLIELDADHNQIWRINAKALIPYPNLQRLNLAHNRIEMLPDGLFKATPDLKWLNLKGNLLKRIETYTFKSLLRIENLYLDHNRIEYINPYALATNARLRELHLEENRITTIDILLYNLPNLSYLNLSSNFLESKALEANVFHQNHKLETLDLSFNRLREFQVGTFNGLESLEVSYNFD